jgi:hypothetical protein
MGFANAMMAATTKSPPPEAGPTEQRQPAAAMKLPAEVHLHASGLPSVIATVEQAVHLIDRQLPPELAKLPRWTFARALLVEVMRTGKSRDMKAAARQFKQALKGEKWLVEGSPDSP